MKRKVLPMSHLDSTEFRANPRQAQEALRAWMDREGVDVFLASAQDMFLSEYNVLCNSHRYALTGFTGSTGDALFLSSKVCAAMGRSVPCLLYVDGRYHLQAPSECDPTLVEVVKLGMADSLDSGMRKFLETVKGLSVVAIDGARNTWRRWKDLEEMGGKSGWTVRVLLENEIAGVLGLPGWSVDRPIRPVPEAATGRTIGDNLTALLERLPSGAEPGRSCVISCASDDTAWILNARGFHTKHSSAVLAFSFVVGREVIVFLPEGMEQCPVEIPPQGGDSPNGYWLTVVRKSLPELREALRALRVDHVCFAAGTMNAFLPKLASDVWPAARVVTDFGAVEWLRARKTEAEIATMRSDFVRSSRAIARTLRWLKGSTALAKDTATSDADFVAPVTERDLVNKMSKEFAAEGALELSFQTISGAAENSAIIHYSAASESRFFKAGEIALLDCGAYYEHGFATDTTRTVYCPGPGATPEAWQKKIYTVVLKAKLACQHAEFDRELAGNQVDLFARNVCVTNGFDYMHGTGHGIGIHVHEGGHRIGKVSTGMLVERGAISIEPGIYLEGKGGVRIENCAIVRAHPTDPKRFVFENLTFIGYDWDLIDVAMLTDREKMWLKAYEKRCQEMGTQVTDCPLS